MAAMQFSARAYPSLIPANGQVVKAEVIGYDRTGQKAKRAERVSKHMSYQIMNRMDGWESDMDKLLLVLPIVGTCFKKTYFDTSCEEFVSRLVLPKDLVVNYWATSLGKAERVTERIFMSKRLVQERVNAEIFLDVDLPPPSNSGTKPLDDDKTQQTQPNQDDDTTPYLILEQHTFLDLDKDGLAEPYVVLVDKESKEVLRITARFDSEGVELDEKGKVVSIDPTQYYTKYSFFPNPDGGSTISVLVGFLAPLMPVLILLSINLLMLAPLVIYRLDSLARVYVSKWEILRSDPENGER